MGTRGLNTRWIVDTNVILRYLLNDHTEFSKLSRDFWEKVREGRTNAILTEGVLMESVYVLTKYYKVPRTTAVQSLSGLLRYVGLEQEPTAIFSDALAEFGSGTLDFVDCLLLVRQRQGLGTVFTFDSGVIKGLKEK